MLNTDPGVSSV